MLDDQLEQYVRRQRRRHHVVYDVEIRVIQTAVSLIHLPVIQRIIQRHERLIRKNRFFLIRALDGVLEYFVVVPVCDAPRAHRKSVRILRQHFPDMIDIVFRHRLSHNQQAPYPLQQDLETRKRIRRFVSPRVIRIPVPILRFHVQVLFQDKHAMKMRMIHRLFSRLFRRDFQRPHRSRISVLRKIYPPYLAPSVKISDHVTDSVKHQRQCVS